MRAYESRCVGCTDLGLPCLGSACPNYSVLVIYCDECGEENAKYSIDGSDLCDDCAKEYINEAFENMSLKEQAELLDIVFEDLE